MTDMRIKYWGVRGSIPTPLTTEQVRDKQIALIEKIMVGGGTKELFGNTVTGRVRSEDKAKIKEYLEKQPLSISGTYGGNTTCIEVQARDSPLIMIDAGTGARALGHNLAKKLFTKDRSLNPLGHVKINMMTGSDMRKDIHLFFTHYHWDHLQGFPFFVPGFIPGENKARIFFYGKKDATKQLSDVLAGQQQFPNFPIVWDDMPCSKDYKELGRMEPHEIRIGDTKVRYEELSHPDAVFGYSIEVNGKKFVVATDTEPYRNNDVKLVKLAQGADIMYYDGQYTPEELRDERVPKQRWGHSTYEAGIDTAIEAGVKKLVLGHHEPTRNDFEIEDLNKKAQIYLEKVLARGLPKDALTVEMAYEGMVQEL